MTTPPDVAPTRRARFYAVALAVASAVILVLGLLGRPTPTETVPPPPSELDLARLARLAQRRAVEGTTEFFSGLAADGVRWVTPVDALNGSGVLWRPDLVVVPAGDGPLPAQITLGMAGRALGARLVASGPHLPIAAYQTSESLPVVETFPPRSAPEPGKWMIAVSRTSERPLFVPGVFVAATEQTCELQTVEVLTSTVAIAPAMRGAAVFDLDGGLVGMVLACGERAAIVSHRSVDTLIARGQSLEGRLLAAFGFRAEQPSLDEAAHLKITEGALVREVWNGFPADASGLWPGDVIREVAGGRVGVPADLAPLLEAATETATVKVQRGSRELVLELIADRSRLPAAKPSAGVALAADRTGHRIEAVSPGSAAFAAGLRSGDILLRINHVEPRNAAELRRLLAGSGSAAAFVEVERDGRRFGVLVS